MTPWMAEPTGAPVVQSETVVEARHDLFGETVVPAYEFLRVADDPGSLRVDAYLGLAAVLPSAPVLQIHALSLEGPWGAARWRVGTQQASTPVRPQTFDGAWVSAPLGRATAITAWGGRARQDDLDDLAAGTGIGRVELLHAERAVTVRIAAEAEGTTSVVGRQDAEVRVGESRSGWVRVLGALAEQQPAVSIEQARAEIGGWLGSRAVGTTWIERRTSSVETLLADSVLPVFAPDGYDDAGARLRLVGRDPTTSLAASGSIGRYEWNGSPVTTYSADAEWVPGLGTGWPAPSWRYRSGAGGSYHAFALTESAPLSDALRLSADAALVPYRKDRDPWRLAAIAGASAAGSVAGRGWLEVGGDVSTDAIAALDLRGFLALTLDWP